MAFARTKIAYRRNLTLAKRLWSGQINREQQVSLKSLSANFGLSIAVGDLQLLEIAGMSLIPASSGLLNAEAVAESR